MKYSLQELQTKLISLGRTLSAEQCKEFRDILDGFAQAYYAIGEVYKMGAIYLIPSKTDRQIEKNKSNSDTDLCITPTNFKPAKTLEDITMSLARNLENQIKKEKE